MQSGDTDRDAGLLRFAAQLAEQSPAIASLTIALVAALAQDHAGMLLDHEGLLAHRYNMVPGTVYLLRPDGHVAARFRNPTPARLREAVSRALECSAPVPEAQLVNQQDQPETPLVSSSLLPDPDAAYRLLAQAHRDLDADESAALNARLVLVLANAVGDMHKLGEAIRLAKMGA
jgi:hypothetical protein